MESWARLGPSPECLPCLSAVFPSKELRWHSQNCVNYRALRALIISALPVVPSITEGVYIRACYWVGGGGPGVDI